VYNIGIGLCMYIYLDIGLAMYFICAIVLISR